MVAGPDPVDCRVTEGDRAAATIINGQLELLAKIDVADTGKPRPIPVNAAAIVEAPPR